MEDLEKALKNLMKIIEEHQMNITIITAEISHWANGDVKEVKESAVHIPTNNVRIFFTYTHTIQDVSY